MPADFAGRMGIRSSEIEKGGGEGDGEGEGRGEGDMVFLVMGLGFRYESAGGVRDLIAALRY